MYQYDLNKDVEPTYEEVIDIPVSSSSASEVKSAYIQKVSDNTFRVFCLTGSGTSNSQYNTYLINLAQDEILPDEDRYYVKQYENRCNGVAKNAGTAGDTIQVYIPLANS